MPIAVGKQLRLSVQPLLLLTTTRKSEVYDE
jgi:hypothetical protein